MILAGGDYSLSLSRELCFAAEGFAGPGGALLERGAGAIVTYDDQGGPWRIGSEDHGCAYRLREEPCSAVVEEVTAGAVLARAVVRVTLANRDYLESWTLIPALGRLELSVTGAAAYLATVAIRLETPVRDGRALMATPAGHVERPLQHAYTPSYWPAVEWSALLPRDGGGGVAVANRGNSAWRFTATGTMEVMHARDAIAEQCGSYGSGVATDAELHTTELAVVEAPDMVAAALAGFAFNAPLLSQVTDHHAGPLTPGQAFLSSSARQVVPTALKPRQDGPGFVVRLLRLADTEVTATLQTALTAGRLERLTALEEPLGALPGDPASFSVEMGRSIETLAVQPPWSGSPP